MPWKQATYFSLIRLFVKPALFIILISLVVMPFSYASEPLETKHILVLSSLRDRTPALDALFDTIRSTIAFETSYQVEFYREHLDLSRFSEDIVESRLSKLIRQKYQGRPIDLIITLLEPALHFVNTKNMNFLTGIPIVYALINPVIAPLKWSPNTTAVNINVDIKGTLDLALKIHPNLQNVIVIAGRDKLGRTFEKQAKEVFKTYDNQVSFTYYSDFSLDEILRKVKSLPHNTIIYNLVMLKDVKGETFLPKNAARLISEASNVPVYGLFDELIGHGIVGGHIGNFEQLGKDTAQVAMRYLGGEATESIPRHIKCDNFYMFDWNEMVRRGISQRQLPSDSIIRNRPLSLFDKYKWRILGGVMLCIIQTMLIVILLVNRRTRLKAEDALNLSEKKFKTIIENFPVGSASLDLDGRLETINSAIHKMLGYDATETSGMVLMDLIHPDDAPRAKKLFKELIAGNRNSYQAESRYFKKNGDLLWVHEAFALLRNKNGEPKWVAGMAADITSRKKAQAELMLNEERLEALLKLNEMENLSENEIISHVLEDAVRLTRSKIGYCHMIREDEQEDEVNFESTIWSKATLAECTTEKTAIHAIGKTGVWANCFKNRRPVIHNDYEDIATKGSCPEGHVSINRHMALPVFDKEKIISIIGVGNKTDPYDDADIRQINLLSQGMRRLIQRIQADKEQRDLEAKLQQGQKMEAIGTLAGGIAHDFNNILSSIFGYTELAKIRSDEGQNAKEELEHVLAAGYRARDLVKHMLTFSRKTEIQKQPLSLSPLIKETLKFLRASLPSTISIKQKIEVSNSRVMADPTQMHQVLMNLCANAAHAMEKNGGKLHIHLKETELAYKRDITHKDLKAGKYLILTVADTGHGILKVNIDKIFDPFFTTKGREKGTGMGLSVVHGIIKDMEGDISVYSEPEKGTTFRILLPQFEGAISKEVVPHQIMPKGKGNILLVDDEKGIVISNRKLLERLGYKATTSTSSIEALKIFKKRANTFDLVLTDYTMPQMNGIELSKQLIQSRPDIPIVLCTGFSAQLTPEIVKKIGIREMIMKPLVASELAIAVKKAMSPNNV